MKIALIPIDNRPVCYELAKQICAIDKDLELFLPDRKYLGDLNKSANIEPLLNWIEQLPQVDAFVLSLDTLAYGGLIPSRRDNVSKEEIFTRLDKLKKLLNKSKKVYACSSIMRISNNNINEEEKEYWKDYGKKIFEYSYNFHKNGNDSTDVPTNILSDYLATRRRNFDVNKQYLDWLKEGIISTLVYSKDDCAEFGINVLEAQTLERIINEKELQALVKTGADEIPLSLLTRAIVEFKSVEKKPKISVKFLAPEFKDLISNYEDISIEKSVKSQIEITTCEVVESDEDLTLIVNNFENHQGEIVMGVDTVGFDDTLKILQNPYMVADVRFANGADNSFVEHFLQNDLDSNFYGYSAWNTSANTLGSLLCAGIVKFLATNYDDLAFRKLQAVRFLDDWAYQANVRQELKVDGFPPNYKKVKNLMMGYEWEIKEKFGLDIDFEYKFPWNRFFEIEILF